MDGILRRIEEDLMSRWMWIITAKEFGFLLEVAISWSLRLSITRLD